MEIVGDKIILRTLRGSDAVSLFQNAKDKDIAKYTLLPHPYRLKNAQDFIKITKKNQRQKKAYELGIELKETKEIIGMISLMDIDRQNKNGELGYWLGKKYWGRKIMKEAIRLILNFGFKRLKLIRVYARVVDLNITSARLLEKAGFSYEGRLRKNEFRNKRWCDELRYSILKEEFKQN